MSMSAGPTFSTGPPFFVVGISQSCGAPPQIQYAVSMALGLTVADLQKLESLNGVCNEGQTVTVNVTGDPSDFLIGRMANPGGYLLMEKYDNSLCDIVNLESVTAIAATEYVCTPVIQDKLHQGLSLNVSVAIKSVLWHRNANGVVDVGSYSDSLCQKFVPDADSPHISQVPDTCVAKYDSGIPALRTVTGYSKLRTSNIGGISSTSNRPLPPTTLTPVAPSGSSVTQSAVRPSSSGVDFRVATGLWVLGLFFSAVFFL